MLGYFRKQLQQSKYDLMKNVNAFLSETVSKMDLVSQDDLKRQQLALANAQKRLNNLQDQLHQLQQQHNKTP